MIKSLIVPLLFSTLVVGIAGHGDDMKRVGRLALRSIIYFELVTTLALVIGLAAVNIIKPGIGVSLGGATAATGAELAAHPVDVRRRARAHRAAELLRGRDHNEVLQIVFFAILFAVALTRQKGDKKQFMLNVCETLSELMFKFAEIVMAFAPIGIGAAIAVTVGQSGVGRAAWTRRSSSLTLYGALIAFAVLVLLPIARVQPDSAPRVSARPCRQPGSSRSRRRRPKRRSRSRWSAWSSWACRARIVAFVMPTGYSFNLDGSTLYLAVASVFAAQAGGIHMTIGQQTRHDAYADADEQRRRCGAAGVAGDPLRRAHHVRPAAPGGRRDPRRGRVHGHGAHVDQPRRELPRERGDGALGR